MNKKKEEAVNAARTALDEERRARLIHDSATATYYDSARKLREAIEKTDAAIRAMDGDA